MNYLIIDTETNGLPQSYHLPVTDLTNWPRLISVAWGLYNEQGKELCRHYALVKPDGYRWNKVAQQIHHITPEQAETKGLPLVDVLNQLCPAMERADAWVGHNIDLDYGVIGAEFIRSELLQPGRVGEFPARPVLCTMDASAKVTPNREPIRLDELYLLLTGKKMKGMHDATADMLSTAHCFLDLNNEDTLKHHRLTGLIVASLFTLAVVGCNQNDPTPAFPTTRAYYSFRVFRPTDPRQPRNEVGFDTLTYRAEDGSTRILTNRTVYFTNEYDTTIYANVPADRILEGYLSARKAQNVTIEVGLIDKSGAKQKQDYRLVGINNQDPASLVPVRVRVRKEVPLGDLTAVNQ